MTSVFEPNRMKSVMAMAKAGTLPCSSKLNIYFVGYDFAGMPLPIPEALQPYLGRAGPEMVRRPGVQCHHGHATGVKPHPGLMSYSVM